MPEHRYARVVVWTTFASLAINFSVAHSFAAFFEPFEAEFAVQRAEVSLVFGLCGLIYFLLGAGAGMLADRFGPHLGCCAGMLFIAAGLLATNFATSITAVYVAYGVGIGVALVYTPSRKVVRAAQRGDAHKRARRARTDQHQTLFRAPAACVQQRST